MTKKKKFKLPSTITLLLALIVVFTVLTWIVPAGSYDRIVNDSGATQVVPGSFHYVEQSPVGIWRIVTSIPAALIKQTKIVTFLLLVGGAIQIISATGVVDAALGYLCKKLGNRDLVIVPAMIVFFAALSACGINTASIAFIPIGLMISKSLKLDNLVAVSIVMMGVCCGWSGGAFTANTTGIAQGIIGLPMYSGWQYRLAATAVFLLFICTYVYRYCKKTRADPTKSMLYGMEGAAPVEAQELPPMDVRHTVGLIIFIVGFCFVVYGAISGWDMYTEISSVFLLMALSMGLVCGMKEPQLVSEFFKGSRSVCAGAVTCGVAAAMNLIMSEGQILDTIVHGLEVVMTDMPLALSTLVMYVFQTLLNTFIPSGSAQAVASIPIVSALGYVLEIPQQIVVLAFNYGDGITNQIIPTSGTLMASIGIACVPWETWVKFVWKMILGMLCIGGVALMVALAINLGPF